VAAIALGELGIVDDSTIKALAAQLDYVTNRKAGFDRAPDLTYEAAVALIKLGQENHPVVTTALNVSNRATADFVKVKAFLERSKRTS